MSALSMNRACRFVPTSLAVSLVYAHNAVILICGFVDNRDAAVGMGCREEALSFYWKVEHVLRIHWRFVTTD